MGRVNVTLVAVLPVVWIAARARPKMHFLDPFMVQNRGFQFQDFRVMGMHATCRSPTSPSIYGGGGFATQRNARGRANGRPGRRAPDPMLDRCRKPLDLTPTAPDPDKRPSCLL